MLDFKIIYPLLYFFILLVSTYTDFKSRIISNRLMLIATFIGISLNIINDTRYYIIVSLIIFIFFLLSPITSGGDIKLLSISALYMQEKLCMFFFMLGIVSLGISIYYKLKNKKIEKLPLAPYILVAFLLTNILYAT